MLSYSFKHALLRYFPAMLSGLLLTAGFPDPGLYWASFFALVPLWISLTNMTPKQGFTAGLAAGLVHFLTLIYWLVPTLTVYGGLNPYLAVATLVLLCGYLALYPAFFAWSISTIRTGSIFAPLWGATVWTALEFVRTHALTGFPWGVLGYSQYDNLLLVQMADLFGVLGISFVVVWCNGALAETWKLFQHPDPGQKKKAVLPLALGALLLSSAMGYGALRRPSIKEQADAAPSVSVAVIQGNIRQDQKWSPKFKSQTVKRYAELSKNVGPADLVIWPETALPFYYGRDAAFSSQVDALVRQVRSPFLIGSPAAEISGKTVRYFNRAYMLTPLGLVNGYYDKSHLVPFGEYVPLQDLLFFVEKLTAEAGNFSVGTTGRRPLSFQSPSAVQAHRTGILICFEILFADISRQFVLNGADLLTTITNDAWFGRTSAPAQHFAIAVLRAVENRRAMARAANTGISGFILPTGEVSAATRLFETAGRIRNLPAMTQTSFFTCYGDILGKAALVAMFLVFVVKRLKNYPYKKHP